MKIRTATLIAVITSVIYLLSSLTSFVYYKFIFDSASCKSIDLVNTINWIYSIGNFAFIIGLILFFTTLYKTQKNHGRH